MPGQELAYMFKHVLVREAAYQLQLPRQRSTLHAQALEILERHFARELDAVALELANHARLARGYNSRADAKLLRKEAQYLAQAAAQARQKFENPLALELYLRLIALPDLDPATRLDALAASAELQQHCGRPAESIALADEALAQARTQSARGLEARLLLVVAQAHRQAGRLNDAQTVAGEALRLFELLHDAAGASRCLSTQGSIEFQRGNVKQSVELLTRSMEMERKRGSEAALGAAYQRLGAAAIVQNRLDEAEQLLAQSETLAQSAGDKQTLTTITGNRGVLLRRRNDYPAALKQYRAAEALNREMGALEGLVQNLGNRASLHRLMGDFEAALACHAEAEEIALRTGNKASLATNVGNRAMLEYLRGNLEVALELCGKCETMLRAVGDRSHLSPVLHRRGVILRALGRPYEALQEFLRAHEVDKDLGDPSYVVTHYMFQAECLATMGAWADARQCALNALEAARKEGRLEGDEFPIMALSVLLRVAYAQGENAEVSRLRDEITARLAKLPPLDAQLRKEFDFIIGQIPESVAPTPALRA